MMSSIEWTQGTHSKLKRADAYATLPDGGRLHLRIQERYDFQRVYNQEGKPPPEYYVTAPPFRNGDGGPFYFLNGLTMRQAKEFVTILVEHAKGVDTAGDMAKPVFADSRAAGLALIEWGEKRDVDVCCLFSVEDWEKFQAALRERS